MKVPKHLQYNTYSILYFLRSHALYFGCLRFLVSSCKHIKIKTNGGNISMNVLFLEPIEKLFIYVCPHTTGAWDSRFHHRWNNLPSQERKRTHKCRINLYLEPISFLGPTTSRIANDTFFTKINHYRKYFLHKMTVSVMPYFHPFN